MNSNNKNNLSENIFADENNKKTSKTETNIKSAMKNVMMNLPGKDFFTYGDNVKRIFEELKKT